MTESPKPNMEGTYEVLITGGGVAGLSAATFTARASLDTVVVNLANPYSRATRT